MKPLSKYIPMIAGLFIAGLSASLAEEPAAAPAEPPVRSRRIEMHDDPSVSERVEEGPSYSFRERSEDFRLRESMLENPKPLDPRLFAPPAPSRETPKSKKNWLTPKSNMDRIQGGEEEDSETSDNSSQESDRPSQGWLVDDVMSRREKRLAEAEKEETQDDGDSYNDEESFSVFDEDPTRNDQDEHEETDDTLGGFTPTSNFLDESRSGIELGSDERAIPLSASGRWEDRPDAETDSVYDQPIQWGGFQEADSSRSEHNPSASFSTSVGFSSSTAAGSIDQLNQQISQTLMTRPGSQNIGASQPYSRDDRLDQGQTPSVRSGAFTRPTGSVGTLAPGRPGPRTTSSAGYSGWSPSGPQEPVQAFEPFSTR